jgi:hypothetical protein
MRSGSHLGKDRQKPLTDCRAAVGKTLQVAAVEAELLPDEKVAAVRRLATGHHKAFDLPED